MFMKHKIKVTVIDKKLYPELQKQYCSDPNAGACPCYNVGDEFEFYRDDEKDDFWHMGLNTLKQTTGNQISLRAVLKCHTVLKHGMQFQDTFIPDYRVVLL